MIIVHGSFPIKAEVREDALDLMRQMAIASKAEEGCISYEFYVGLLDPNQIFLFQEWESADALQGHFETEHMEQFLHHLPDVLDGEVATRRYEIRVGDDAHEPADFEPESMSRSSEHEKIIH